MRSGVACSGMSWRYEISDQLRGEVKKDLKIFNLCGESV